MISVGSRDGRKWSGLGFGAGGEMEETELEEGEACSYQNDDDSTIDPDIALSYIDKKLKDVLGHFQKDFEGGVSAENLGAKFGGYGSFLPVDLRSPVWSRPRTPPKVHNHNIPRSPDNFPLEGGCGNSVVPSTASLSKRHGPYSVNDSSRKDLGMPSAHSAEGPSTRCEVAKNCTQPSDQKTLKVRIKVGSDNLSNQKNAEIYSGLGLDVSPSTSLDESPTNIERFSHESGDAPDLSPASILLIMTSFPVHGNLLLSPLPGDLINLIEKEKLQGESKPRPTQRGGQGSLNGTNSARGDDKGFGMMKPKSFQKTVFQVDLKNQNSKDTHNGTDFLLKKDMDVDTLASKELVDALKRPVVSNSYSNVGNSGKSTATAVDRVLHEVKDAIEMVEKPSGKAVSVGKIWEDKKKSFHGLSVNPRNGSNFEGEEADGLAKAESNVSSAGRKARIAESTDPSEHKASKQATSCEDDNMLLASGKEHLSSKGQKKSKGSQSYTAEPPKGSSRMESPSVPKIRKSIVDNSKLQKEHGMSRNTYRDFFGEIELEQGDNDMDSAEMLLTDKPKDLEVVEKSTHASNSTSKERFDGRKIDKPSTSEAYLKAAPGAAQITGNGPSADTGHGPAGPLVKEDWVCCDKCQKWRLLPVGTNPDSLPEKWICSMLNWLPGMNRCSFSEEETTKALIAHYQIPAPEARNNQEVYPSGVQPGLSMAVVCSYENGKIFGSQAVPSGKKKKNEVKEASAAMTEGGPTQFANSMKSNLQASVKNRSASGANQSLAANETEPQHSCKSNVSEKHRNMQKEKNKLLEHRADRGEIRSSKSKSKRDRDKDCLRVSKKTKLDNMHHTDEKRRPDRQGPGGKVRPSSSSGLSVNASGKDIQNYDDNPHKDKKYEANSSSQGPFRNFKDQGLVSSDDVPLHMENFDNKGAIKKRKTDDTQDALVQTMPLTGHHLNGRSDFLEETSETNHKKEKKARVSNSEGKETSVSKSSGGTAKKGRKTKDQQLGPDLGSNPSRRSLDATDSLRKNLGSVQPSQAATSSSSKVSGSRKNITGLKEVKGSPIESVSSSPMRFIDPDKPVSANLEGKDDSGDADIFVAAAPRRRSSGEDDKRSGRSGAVRKDETLINNRGSLESSVTDVQQRDMGHLSVSEVKIHIRKEGRDYADHHFANGDTDTLGNGTHYCCESQTSDQHHCEERRSDKHYHANVSRPRKSGKGSLSQSKENNGTFESEHEKDRAKVSDFCNESVDHAHSCEGKSRTGQDRVQEKSGICSDKVEKNSVAKKEFAGENSKRENQSRNGSNIEVEALSRQEQIHNLRLDRDGRSSKRHLLDETDRVEVSGRGKTHSLPPSGRGQNETVKHSNHLVSGSQKENGANNLFCDASKGDDTLTAPKVQKMSDNQNGNQPVKSRHPTANGHRVRDVDAPSPARRDSSSQAVTDAVREGKNLKHMADRLKNSGSNSESTSLYLQAALKFLHGASLLESCNSESAKQSEMIQSIQMYSSTAKLCEFCAHEYEKSKDMAAAALAYKCMEVAYMRVIYHSHSSASRDRHELQTALQIVPPGESPSSSASDVDNLNNPTSLDKVPLAKGVSSPQVAGNHVIAARNRPNFVRLLNFAQEVNFAMEASRKSRIAFEAANSRMEEAQYRESINSVKRALDFNFQDVERLLRLVRQAMDAISR